MDGPFPRAVDIPDGNFTRERCPCGCEAFHTDLAGGDATGSSNDALYFRRAGSGALTPMARRGRPAPVRLEDAPPNYTGENLWSALNRHGTFAYTDNDTGMWLANPTAANPFRFSTTLDRCWLGHRIGGRRQAVYIPVTRRGR